MHVVLTFIDTVCIVIEGWPGWVDLGDWLYIEIAALSHTVFDDVLVTKQEHDASVLDAKTIVQNFEIFAEWQLVITSTQRDLKHLMTAHKYVEN